MWQTLRTELFCRVPEAMGGSTSNNPTLTSLSGDRLDGSFLIQWGRPERNRLRACCPRWDSRSCVSVGPAEVFEKSPVG